MANSFQALVAAIRNQKFTGTDSCMSFTSKFVEEKPTVCFLSAQSRSKILNSYPTHRPGIEITLKNNPHLYPGRYDTDVSYKYLEQDARKLEPSVAAFGKSSPRIPIAKVDNEVGPFSFQPDRFTFDEAKQNMYPFNLGASRWPNLKHLLSPGPAGTTTFEVDKRRIVQDRFGTKREIPSTIHVFCVDENLDKCRKCEIELAGMDYYKGEEIDLCFRCFKKIKSERKHDAFLKVRDCSFMHKHQGSLAASQILSDKDWKKLKRREAYLSRYYK